MSDILKKVELLSPAGSYESAIAAIQNGCDALYMAGTKFGARASATNFNNEQLEAIVKYAHAYDVKVYITLNTLLHDDELQQCLEYIDFLYSIHIDALIIQDLGLLYEVRKRYDDFEIHASTQMHVTNKEALLFLKKMGVKRAVLARETPIEEIRELAKVGIELEVFVHGALCVAYSGQCLMSAMVGGRSGNRGECAQTCRMPYTLIQADTNKVVHEQAYLLSLKDLNTLKHIQELIEAGITSFKIEGRMKKSEYVGHITRLYKMKIENAQAHITDAQMQQAKVLFHRGYTSGFLYRQKGSLLYNPYRPNHLGIEIGKVLAYNHGKVKIHLTQDLYQHDGIRILQSNQDYGFKVNRLYLNGKLANFAPAQSNVEIECHEVVKKGSLVVKTSDPKVEKEIRNQYEKITRRVAITMKVIVKANEVITMMVDDGIRQVTCQSEQYVEYAQNRATTKTEVEKQCQKINDTIFRLEDIEIIMDDDLFIPIKVLNALRRDTLQQIYLLRSSQIHRERIPFKLNEPSNTHMSQLLCASVCKEEQLRACLGKVDAIYVRDNDLYERFKHHNNVYLSSNRIMKDGYDNMHVIHDIGGLYDAKEKICDTGLNVYNASTCYVLSCLQTKRITFSHELDQYDIKNCLTTYQQRFAQSANTEVVVYGRVEVMVSEHCPINACILDNGKKDCTLCRYKEYALKDKFNNVYPMMNDHDCRMHLYDYKIIDHSKDVQSYLKMGVQSIRMNFTFEDFDTVTKVIQGIQI